MDRNHPRNHDRLSGDAQLAKGISIATIPRTRANHCQACATGTYSLSKGWATCDACEACEAGEYRTGCGGTSAGTCPTCDQGDIKLARGEWNTMCTACPSGTFGDDRFPRSDAKHCAACARHQPDFTNMDEVIS